MYFFFITMVVLSYVSLVPCLMSQSQKQNSNFFSYEYVCCTRVCSVTNSTTSRCLKAKKKHQKRNRSWNKNNDYDDNVVKNEQSNRRIKQQQSIYSNSCFSSPFCSPSALNCLFHLFLLFHFFAFLGGVFIYIYAKSNNE